MKRLLLVVAVLLSLPAAFAQEVYISHYSANYTLGEGEFSVTEAITFNNEGDAFKENVFLLRGDARDVEVQIDKTHIWKSEYSVDVENGITVVRFPNLVIAKGTTREITLTYKRSDLLQRVDSLYVLSGPVFANLPWNILEAEIQVMAPEGYQFGETSLLSAVDFEVARTREGRKDVIGYRLRNLPEGESLVAELEYADFESLTLERLSIADGYVDDALVAIANANKSIENAKKRGADVEAAVSMYGEAIESLKDAEERMQTSAITLAGDWIGFKNAYESAMEAQEAAKEAQNSALEASDEANFAIQMALEERIEEMGTNLSKESKQLTQDISQRLEELKEMEKEAELPPERDIGVSRVKYLIEILVLALAAFVALNIARVRERRIERVGRVDDFRVIDDLKRKEFKGFDKKVDKVKKGVEVAKDIRELKAKRQKLGAEIEVLRKKKVAGKLPAKEFTRKKRNLTRRMDRLDSKIDELTRKMKDIREVK